MRRYWIEKKYFKDDLIIIEGDDFHHICGVCRQSLDDKFEVLQEGIAYLVQIIQLDKRKAVAKILSQRALPELSKPWIRLCVSVSKFATMDLIIEKAVELGAYSLHPFVSDFSFVRQLNDPKIKNKKERWDRIAKSATQQTGRGNIMDVHAPESLESLLNKFNQNSSFVGLFPYEGEASLGIKEAVEYARAKKPEEIWVFIGSEGGFSEQEVDLFSRYKMPPVTLGDQVLRVETACLSVLSILKYEFNLSKN